MAASQPRWNFNEMYEMHSTSLPPKEDQLSRGFLCVEIEVQLTASDMPGRKFKLSVHRKNDERKRRFRQQSPSLVISPARVLSESPVHLTVSLPKELYVSGSVDTLVTLRTRLSAQPLTPNWFLTSASSSLSLFKIQHYDQAVKVTFTICIDDHFQWSVCFLDKILTCSNCTTLSSTPSHLNSVSSVMALSNLLDMCLVCTGNQERALIDVAKHRDSIRQHTEFECSSTLGVCFEQETVRHKDCQLLLPPSSSVTRCDMCVRHRSSLLIQSKRLENPTRASLHSHTNHRYLSRPELMDRLESEHHERRIISKRLQRLKERLAEEVEKVGVTINPEIEEHIREIASQEGSEMVKKLPPDSFRHIFAQKIFWDQQMEAASRNDTRGLRWHPLMIRWCLYIRYRSSGAYEALRESGVLTLPSQRTLRDYTHHIDALPGFSTEADTLLVRAAKVMTTTEERNKYVLLLLDEMHIREDLVYDKHSGEMIGFANLGNVNKHLDDFEQALSSTSSIPSLAKTVLVFMVRGLFDKLQFAYAQFPCTKLRGDLLFEPFWEAVRRVELCGLKVLGATFDGNSVNRRLIKLHNQKSKLLHKTTNPFSPECRPFFFFSDPPHLMKTARNCMLSKARILWCNGKEISWGHIVNLYYQDKRPGVGLTLLPKLKLEHIKLNSFSKMRVDLAVQVLSESVSKALTLTGGSHTEETAKFVMIMDKFFDCLNVHNFTHGFRSRKEFQLPYRSKDDKRLKWLKETFLGYLDAWEKSVKERDDWDYTKEMRNRMLLSSETMLGLRITALSFIELVEYLFKVPGVGSFLSQRISQDPIENFFGCQRQCGGTHDNPNLQEFQKNMQTLRVVNSFAKGPIKGNCRGLKGMDDITTTDILKQPLPKRQKKE